MVCPFSGSAYGAHPCAGTGCVFSDKYGSCLIKKAVNVFIEKQEFDLACKKRELDEKVEKTINQTKMLEAQSKCREDFFNLLFADTMKETKND